MKPPASALAAVLLALTLSACGHSGHGSDAAGPNHSMPDGSTMPGMSMGDGDGRKATVDGYTLAAVKVPAKAGQDGTLSFRIDGPQGAQKDFTRQQTKLMHVYIVRADLTEYQHVHPELDSATGEWTVPLTLAQPGPYRVVTEFQALTPDGNLASRILGQDFSVGGSYTPASAMPTPGTASVDGYDLRLDGEPKIGGGEITLTITRDGEDVHDLEPYLASFAHITGFRTGDLTSVHVHPNETPEGEDAKGGPSLTLAPLFNEPGRYRMFIQFQTAGELHLVPIDIEVT